MFDKSKESSDETDPVLGFGVPKEMIRTSSRCESEKEGGLRLIGRESAVVFQSEVKPP
jgi:hypothetical protein